MDIGANIRRLRELNNWTQQELAMKAGYKDKTAISSIENGKNQLNQAKIEKFAQIFGVSISEIIGIGEHSISYDDLDILDKIKVLPEKSKRSIVRLVDLLSGKNGFVPNLEPLEYYLEEEEKRKEMLNKMKNMLNKAD